jgi:hypothetical protein
MPSLAIVAILWLPIVVLSYSLYCTGASNTIVWMA